MQNIRWLNAEQVGGLHTPAANQPSPCYQRLTFTLKCFQKSKLYTCNLGCERAAWDVLVIVLDQYAVVPR